MTKTQQTCFLKLYKYNLDILPTKKSMAKWHSGEEQPASTGDTSGDMGSILSQEDP